jgi:Domain of unknown function (DUF6379)
MFDKYLIVDGTIRNLQSSGKIGGFTFEAKLGYYRGLGLSMIEALDISIDGEAVPAECISFDEGAGPLRVAEMATSYDRRWPFGHQATITVDRPGGLAQGGHRIEFRQKLRISYLPFPLIAEDAKHFTVTES